MIFFAVSAVLGQWLMQQAGFDCPLKVAPPTEMRIPEKFGPTIVPPPVKNRPKK